MKRQRQRQHDMHLHDEDQPLCVPPPLPPHPLGRDSIPESPTSHLIPPPIPSDWATAGHHHPVPAASTHAAALKAADVRMDMSGSTDWVMSLQQLLSSYQADGDTNKLHELRDKISAQLQPTSPSAMHCPKSPPRRQGGARRGHAAHSHPPRTHTTHNKDWQLYPGVCAPSKKPHPPKRVRQLEALLSEGLLVDGESVYYRSKQGECLAQGVINGAGIECLRCGRVVACTEFEQCAGSAMRKPCQHIVANGSGQTLQQLMQLLPPRDV